MSVMYVAVGAVGVCWSWCVFGAGWVTVVIKGQTFTDHVGCIRLGDTAGRTVGGVVTGNKVKFSTLSVRFLKSIYNFYKASKHSLALITRTGDRYKKKFDTSTSLLRCKITKEFLLKSSARVQQWQELQTKSSQSWDSKFRHFLSLLFVY